MTHSTPQERISRARGLLVAAEQNLRSVIMEACPDGYAHRVKRHRDGQQPWCPACGRSNEGELLGESRAATDMKDAS